MASGPEPMRHSDMPAVINELTAQVVDAVMTVHARLGRGLLERPYKLAVAHELRRAGRRIEVECPVSIVYDDLVLERAYRVDIVIEDLVAIEVKATAGTDPSHVAQMLTYLRLGGFPVGLLVNFNELPGRDGIRRYANRSAPALSALSAVPAGPEARAPGSHPE